jgi:DNA polymerase-1
MTNVRELKPTFLIIDGHALIYRAFHAFPPLTDNEGNIVGALYGFLRILLTVLKQVQPEYWLVAFDHPAPTNRKKEFSFYKANRKEMPEQLQPQIPLIEEAVTHLGIPEMKIAGIEADDIIGTVSRLASPKVQVLILTGDKDSFQLINDNIHVLVPNLGRRRQGSKEKGSMIEYNPALVHQKMHLPPDKIIDFKALAGDASDNISGVTGIGPKTAVNLINRFGSLEDIYRALDLEQMDDLRSSIIAKLNQDRENAFISKKLATIDCFVELDFNLETCRVSHYDKQEMAQFLQDHDFNSLIKLLPDDEFDTGLQETLF